MVDAGFSLTQQAPATAIATVDIGDRTPTDLWHDLATTPEFQAAIINAIRDSARGRYPDEFRDELEARDLPLEMVELGVRIAKGDKRAVFQLLQRLTNLGAGWTTTEDVLAAPRLLEGGETPTVALRVRTEFFDRRADQRRDVCALVATLSETCDVRVVATGLVQRKLANKHREDLPSVSEACNAHPHRPPSEEVVETARAELVHDSREVHILRELATDPAQTLSYRALKSTFHISRSRISQCVSRLVGLELVDTFAGSESKAVELLEAGRSFLDALDADIGRQAELEECVSENGTCSKYSRVPLVQEGGEETSYTDRRRHGALVEVEYMPRWRHAAVTGSATEGGVTLLNQPQEPSEELRQPYLSYDEKRLVVGAEYTNPLQYWVSITRALADRRVWTDVLTPERLDGEVGNLGGLLTDDTRILRDARCLGYLKDADANGADYAEALMQGVDELCSLLRRLHAEDYEDRNQFRGLITRHAHGLAGIVAHLCDLAGVELVREVRLPEFSRRFDTERREDLIETLVYGISISSRHGHFAAYRQLLEDREEKRAAAMTPSIPDDDPVGEMIGSFVIVSDTATSLAKPLRERLHGTEPHEDAPEFEIAVPVRTEAGRSGFENAAQCVLEGKNLSPTEACVSLLHALAGTPYDAAAALGSALASEDVPQPIRLDEVRRALATLPTGRLLSDMKPTVRKTANALLTAVVPYTKSELADRADVSTRSLRDHLPKLEALGLVEEVEAGYRFVLPFETTEERGVEIAPALVTDATVAPPDALYELGEVLVGTNVHDPEHPMGTPFYEVDPIERMDALRETFGEWARLAARLAGWVRPPEEHTTAFGKPSVQAPIQGVTAD